MRLFVAFFLFLGTALLFNVELNLALEICPAGTRQPCPPIPSDRPGPPQVCSGDTLYLNQNEIVAIRLKPGCAVNFLNYVKGDVEETMGWPSGRSNTSMRGQTIGGNFTYPEWPPEMMWFKAITPATISFLAQAPPSQSLSPPNQAESQAQTTTDFSSTPYYALAFVVGCALIWGIARVARSSSVFVIAHWSKLIENLQASPIEFYASVETAIKRREVPDIQNSRVDWKEGGLFTTLREYLRISREKHVLDICSAPYGTGFFISWWLGELRPSPIGPTLATAVIVFSIYRISIAYFDNFLFASFLTVLAFILLFLFVGIFVNHSKGENWVRYVLVIPVVGWLIERFFLPPTYYRIDTALMFQSAIHASIQEVIDQLTQAKGLHALTELERRPILRELFQK